MSPSSLADLKALKYAELRALAKENNLKASGKTEALVASLAAHFGFSDSEAQPDQEPAPAPQPAKKRVTSGSKAKAQGDDVQQEQDEQPAPAQTPVKVQEKIIYQTSPGTKASVAALLATVKDLQSQLTSARSSITTLEGNAQAPRSPTLKKADVLSLIDGKVAEFSKSLVAQLGDLEVTVESTNVQQEEDRAVVQQLQSELRTESQSTAAWKTTVERSLHELRTDLTTRLSALDKQQPALKETSVATASPRSRKVSFADSPTVSDLDAPPTRSVSFSSPGSPAPLTSTPLRSSLASTASRKATPFKLNLPTSGAAATPASALPPHMAATAASAAKRSPRSPRVSAPEPMSPARPASNANLGKRSRHSDASELSLEVAAVVDPEEGAKAPVSPSSSRTLSEILAAASTSAKKDDGHARKRMRVSTGTVIDHGSDVEEEEHEALPEASFNGGADDSLDYDETDDDEAENSVREYLVKIKTGDEEPTALKPFPSAAAEKKVSTSDPSFFSFPPVSPNAAGRRATLTGTSAKENAPAPRKSLPMAALPCPIVSPYTKSAPSDAPASSKKPAFSFGTPAAAPATPGGGFKASDISNRRITIGPAAGTLSARKVTPSAAASSSTGVGRATATPKSAAARKSAPYSAARSASKAKPTPALSASARKIRAASNPALLATPPAARTLFGSERFAAPSSAASAATSAAQTAWEGDDEDDEEQTTRFGDFVGETGFRSALTSPEKGWALGAGVFGGRA
ncbi:hypothetical protein JCM10207_000943 [Rhodosporidiobolus poonsookiae]